MSKFCGMLFFIVLAVVQLPEQARGMETKEQFINNLLNQMNLLEKIGQLNQLTSDMDQTGPSMRKQYREDIKQGKVGSILNAYSPAFVRELQKIAVEETRLKIPILFAYDVIHGHRTIFPIPLAESSSWNLKLAKETAQVAASEAAADGVHWTFSPMVDISRDPRWGRVAEGSGEDVWLGTQIATAKVKGYQGDDLSDPNSILACVKHFALYGAPMAGRDYNSVDMSQRSMFETYFPPYRAAVDAGAATVMTSFNDLNGIPSTANSWLLKDLLKESWKFKGFVVTDYTAINELVPHGIAENNNHAAELAMKAGVDMDMQSAAFLDHLEGLVKQGKISEDQINDSVRRILAAKYDLGLFRDPFRKLSEDRARKTMMTSKSLDLAKQAARESIVLLKNSHDLLPLKKGSRIALIGPFANNQRDLIGNWSAAGDWNKAVSIEQGLKKKTAMKFSIQHEKGANILGDDELIKTLNRNGAKIEKDGRSSQKMIEDAVSVALQSDIIIAALGESQAMSGEAASRVDIGLPVNQMSLLKALVETGKPIVLVLMNGRPLTIEWENDHVGAILETWFLGTAAGDAIADVLVGDYNPSGKITMTFPRSVGQIPIFYGSKNTGRPADPMNKYTSKYIDSPNDPLFPFGFGLSYSKFEYSEVKLSKSVLSAGQKLTASVIVKNVGKRKGVEIVQLYIRDVVSSLTRPIKELRGFKRIGLNAGESAKIEFELAEADLQFYDESLKKIVEPGEFRVMIGPNSRDLKSAHFNFK